MDQIHIGKAIQEKVRERGLSIAEFARMIHCDRTNIYSVFRRKSIDTEQLIIISKALDFDFIAQYHTSGNSEKQLMLVEVDSDYQEEYRSDPRVRIIQSWKLLK